jgi:hypothetical protein
MMQRSSPMTRYPHRHLLVGGFDLLEDAHLTGEGSRDALNLPHPQLTALHFAGKVEQGRGEVGLELHHQYSSAHRCEQTVLPLVGMMTAHTRQRGQSQ